MNTIKLQDKTFEPYISAEKIEEVIDRIANELNRDYAVKEPLVLVMLNGAFMFAGDLFKKVNINCDISFVKYASYSGTRSSHNIKMLIGVNENVRGRDIVIVEDIVDSGLTMESLMKYLKEWDVKDIKIATLLFKPEAFTKDYKIDYIGMEISNDFIVVYGLDYDGKGRNLPEIYKLKS